MTAQIIVCLLYWQTGGLLAGVASHREYVLADSVQACERDLEGRTRGDIFFHSNRQEDILEFCGMDLADCRRLP